MTLQELLPDPVRTRIYVDVLLIKERTTQDLMKSINISRSTMSHHLTRFVKEGVFNVRVQSTGRSVKFYSINPKYSENIIIDKQSEPALRTAFLKSSSALLQVVSNLLLERTQVKEVKSSKKKRAKSGTNITFTFSFLSKDEAKIWYEEYHVFEKRLQERLKAIKSGESSMDYIAYGGLTPLRSSES